MRNNNNKLPQEVTENEELIDYFKQQLLKKQKQRNLKIQRQILECDEANIQSLFSNEQSFISNNSNGNIKNIESQYITEGMLGKGTYGEVYLVKERSTGKEFALKMLHKNKIIENNMYKYAITERSILQIVDHPFIVKLFKTFQTNQKIFFLMENGKLGDILQHLKLEKKFSETKAQFYAAQTLLALEYLHSMDIIHRDIKAQNILIAEDGNILLTDFGLSKEGIKEYDKGARSFCGSVAYMPPEILRNQGHGKSVDIYLLGIFIFEMLTGSPPFYGKDDKIQKYVQIQKGKDLQQYLNELTQISSTHILNCQESLTKGIILLSKDSRFRPTPEQIKRHPFFQGMNWNQLYQKNIKPPKTILKQQFLQDTRENIFQDNEQAQPSSNQPPKNVNNEIQLKEQQKLLFNRWTFISNNKQI